MLALLGDAGHGIRVSEAMSVVPTVSAIIGPGAHTTNLVRLGIRLTGHWRHAVPPHTAARRARDITA